MASGLLGQATLLVASGDVLLYSGPPAGSIAQPNVRFCNPSASASGLIRLAIGAGGAPATSDYLEYDFPISAGGVLEDTGLLMSSGEKVWARTSLDGIYVCSRGFEEVRAAGSGWLASRNLMIADGLYNIFTTASLTVTTVNVRFCNRNGVPAHVKLGFGGGGAPTHYMENGATIPANGVIEDTLICTSAVEKIWVQTDTDNISVRVYGVAEAP